jgi:hypothetical protein
MLRVVDRVDQEGNVLISSNSETLNRLYSESLSLNQKIEQPFYSISNGVVAGVHDKWFRRIKLVLQARFKLCTCASFMLPSVVFVL